MKILLLEDNTNLAEIIQEILEEKGHQVVWFEDGEKALEHLLEGFDCFVLDIHVPHIDGLELLGEIRAREPKTPAIIISANIELETIQKAYNTGCNDFLKKPFYMVELERKIALLCPAPTRLGLQGGFTFDTGEELLYDKESKAIKLTLKERRFLALLAKTPNIIVSLHAIEDYVWEGEETSLSSIRSLVKRLRGKLGEESIETQNYGYRLLVPYM